MDARTLAGRLAEPSGWASLMKSMFRDGKAKRAHAIYSTAQCRGVFDNHELRFATHEFVGYAVMAFSITGPLDLPTRKTLAVQADRFPLGAVRHESRAYNTLLPLGSDDPAARPIQALGDLFQGLYVYVAVTSAKGPDRPLVVHAGKDGDDYIYPIPGDRLR